MLVDLLATLAMVGLVLWFVQYQGGRPAVQIYVLIVASYLNIFPAFHYLFSDGRDVEEFCRYQLLVIVFFEVPLLLVLFQSLAGTRRMASEAKRVPARLAASLPWVLGMSLLVFWFVAIEYRLFFRRLGHQELQQASAEVPGLLLYCYRCVVETAFFVIVYLWVTVRSVVSTCRHYLTYHWLLRAYLGTFLLFFAANSRMQFVLLMLCLICTQPHISALFFKRRRLMYLGGGLVFLVFGLTLFRELVLEHNGRISTNDLFDLLLDTGSLISARLDSLMILYPLTDRGFDPWGFDLSGVAHVFNFYISFFFDPSTYAVIKESLVTSPSVEIVNSMLPVAEVDFPKSMILDVFLGFGVVGLMALAVILGYLVAFVQRQLNCFSDFKLAYILCLYLLPMLLEFEKEFMSFTFAFFKWSPILLLLYWYRPRRSPPHCAYSVASVPLLTSLK